MFIPIILCVLTLMRAQQVELHRVYELNQLTDYRNVHTNRVLGCQAEQAAEFSAGTYIRQKGVMDALNVIITPNNLYINVGCLSSRLIYGLVFGPDEQYDKLIKENPQTVAREVISAVPEKYQRIINWQYSIEGKTNSEILKSAQFLNKLMTTLPSNKTILRLPAEIICYSHQQTGVDYLKAIGNAHALIIDMYGRGSKYQSYEEIFTKTSYTKDEQNYKESCPKYPSLAKLKELIPGKQVYIGKTLKQYVQGYVWNFEEMIQKARKEGILIDRVFYDDYQQNMIRL